MTSPQVYTAAELTPMLRAHARGWYPAEAAAELLIRHDVWLLRGDFVHAHVHAEPAPSMATNEMWAWVDWEEAIVALDAGVLPCSGSEARILRIAASIGAGVLINLGESLSSLDTTNVLRVIHAIQHANGDRGVWPAEAAALGGRSPGRQRADDER